MTTSTATAAEQPTLDDLETSLRTSLATIRKAWAHLADPTRPAGLSSRSAPGSRFPGSTDAISLRAEIVRDLAFWATALLRDHTVALEPPAALIKVPVPTLTVTTTWQVWAVRGWVDARDINSTTAWMGMHAHTIAAWDHGNRFAAEMADHAHDARNIAWPKTNDTMLLGACTNTIGADGTPIVCDTPVRANATSPGDVKCPGCGLTDTVDGWILRIVGTEGLVTIPQLVPLLRKRMGLSVSERTLRRWHREGRIPSAGGSEKTPKFDRRTVFAAVTRHEHLDRTGS